MSGTTSPEPRGKGRDLADRLDFVDGLRGFAVGLVLLRHYYMDVYAWGLPRWSDVLGLGYLGVHLFLMLSGFCISWPYVGRSHKPFVAGEFVFRRATRILPAYYGALAIALALEGSAYAPRELAFQVITHLTMVHNLFPSTVVALCGPFWSLALESQLYVCFPLLLFGFRRAGVARTLAVTFLLQMLFRLYVVRYGTGYTDETFVLPWSVAGRVFEFGLGMWAAAIVGGKKLPNDAPWVKWLFPVAMLAAFAAAWVAKGRLGVTHPLTDTLWSAGFFALLLGGSVTTGPLHPLLTWRPLVRLGVTSYSVYLIHSMVLGYATRVAIEVTGHKVHPLLLAPLPLAATLLVCFLYYAAIEHPAIRFFRTAPWRRKPAGSPTPAA
jgi:peptidoglycan/LPS O-acetylase OafA/YrhL